MFDLAFTHGQVMLQHLNVSEPDAQLYGRLASAIIYSQTRRRAPASLLFKNRRGQSGLWGYGISGDLPIVLLRISEVARIDLVRQLVRAHGYWRSKGLAVDLVIWNEDHSGYRQELHDQIMGLITAQAESQTIERPGGIFLRRADQMPEEDRVLLESVARVILSDSGGTFAEQVERRSRLEAAGADADSDPRRLRHAAGRRRGRRRIATGQRPRRIFGRWTRICHHDVGRQPDAGTLGQRAGQCELWHASFPNRAVPIPGAKTPTNSG